MTKELIKTPEYLLVVDDSEIKKGDYFYVTTKNIYGGNIISQSTGNGEFAWSEHILSKDTDEKGYHPSHCKKAIAHLPLNDSPILEGVPLLPPLEEGVFVTPSHFKFEMEDGFSKNNDEYIDESGAKGNYYTHLKAIKTTTNSQGQQVDCGKYIY